jgi:WD40 repeat protein
LTVPDSGHVGQLTFSPDDLRLGFALSGDQIQVWDVFAGDECRTLYDTEAEELSALDVHPGGRLLATAHANGVTFWDLAKSRRLAGMSVGGTTAVRFHPASGDLVDGEFRGTYCFSVEPDGMANEALILKPKKDFYLGTGTVAVDAAAKADVLAIAYDDRIRLARNTNSAYSVIGELIGKPGFRTVAVSPNGLQIAAGNWTTGDVWLWESTNWTTSGAGSGIGQTC